MTALVPFPGQSIPTLIRATGRAAQLRVLEFFIANIRNAHTRRACGSSGWHAPPGVDLAAFRERGWL